VVIGILSDTHGNLRAVRQAIGIFEECDAGAVFHCGDVGGLDVLRELAATGRSCWFVWGNTDLPNPDWAETVAAMGLYWPDGPLLVELDGKRIGVAHGHEWQLAAMKTDPLIDYILSGHTHQCRDERNGHARIINPGALHRTAVRTVATLDLATDELRFHELPG